METARDLYIDGLKNAHAMERQAQEMLERQSERLTDYPDLRRRVVEHLEETKQQLARLERCLSAVDSSPSTIKDVALSFGANMAALSHAMANDEVLKNTFASNALEAYEIAAYKSLLTLAKQAGIQAVGLDQSLQEEERMAKWMDEHTPSITMEFLRLFEKEAA